MADLTTKYLGLTLKNPLIAGSSGLTDSIENIKELEKHGIGAVVIKSLFEEQIMMEAEATIKEAYSNDLIYTQKSEALDYIDLHIEEDALSDYISMIEQLKKEVTIPIISSINCVSSSEWIKFAKRIEKAGADAIELNIAILPSDINMSSDQRENIFLTIISNVRKEVKIPVSFKISPYFSNLAQMAFKASDAGANGLVLFNRSYNPDFDLDSFTEKSANTFSCPFEYSNTLRWIAILSGKVKCELSASSGNYDGQAVIKQLLAGAQTVQIVSTLYKNGLGQIRKILDDLEDWMDGKGYHYIDQFRGKMSQKEVKNPAIYERVQFMKYFSGIN